MTVSRSFAPPTDDSSSAPPPAFPLLPYAYLAYAEHCSRDYAGYMASLADPEIAPTVEDALGFSLLADMNQAFLSLVWAPFGAAIAPPPE